MSPRTRLYLSLFFALLTGSFAWVMYARAGAEELWGYLPLALYLSAWAAVSLFVQRNAPAEAHRRFYQSTTTGVLLGIGFPGYLPVPLLLLVAWVPLLVLQRRDLSAGKVFRHGLNAFLLYNILATFWVTNTAFAAGLFAVVVNSLLMGIPWMLFHWTSRVSPRVSYLSLVAFWLGFEYFHYNWSLNWPWLTLGNGFAQWPSLVQWYELTGVLGGSAWILMVNWLAMRFYLHPRPRSVPYHLLAAALLPMAASLLRFHTYVEPEGETITVSAIQPNFEPHYEKFSGSTEQQAGTLLGLSAAALTAAPGPVDYLLLPETTFSSIDEANPLGSPVLAEFMEKLPSGKGQVPDIGHQCFPPLRSRRGGFGCGPLLPRFRRGRNCPGSAQRCRPGGYG